MLNTVVGQVPVVVPPCERLPNVFLRLEGLHQLDNLQIRDIDLGVLGGVEVLFRVQDSLLEQKLVHLDTILLWDQHGAKTLPAEPLRRANWTRQIRSTRRREESSNTSRSERTSERALCPK